MSTCQRNGKMHYCVRCNDYFKQGSKFKEHPPLCKIIKVRRPKRLVQPKRLGINASKYFLKIYDEKFFNGSLKNYVSVKWVSFYRGPQNQECAGVTMPPTQKDRTTIKLNWCPLRKHQLQDIKNTLVHEMIHSFLMLKGRERAQNSAHFHGSPFLKEMRRINSFRTGVTITPTFKAV